MLSQALKAGKIVCGPGIDSRSFSLSVIIRPKPQDGIHQDPGHSLTAGVSSLIAAEREVSAHADPVQSDQIQSLLETGLASPCRRRLSAAMRELGVGFTFLLLIFSRSKNKMCYNFHL